MMQAELEAEVWRNVGEIRYRGLPLIEQGSVVAQFGPGEHELDGGVKFVTEGTPELDLVVVHHPEKRLFDIHVTRIGRTPFYDGLEERQVPDMIYKWSNITAAHTRKRAATDLPAAFLRELWNKQGGICPLTHRTMKIAGTGYVLDAPSLDRIDPIGGYVANNVRIVTFQANSARMNGTDADLLAFCRAVLAYLDKLKR